MGFLSGISNIFHGIGRLFGGGDDEEQKKKQQQQQQQQTSYQAPHQDAPVQNANPNQPADINQLLAKANPANNPGTQLIQSGGTGPTKVPWAPNNDPNQPPKPQAPPQPGGKDEIDRMTAANLQKAKDDMHTSWLDRNIMDRNWQKEAESRAKVRAVHDYQEKYGYNKQPEVAQTFDEIHGIQNKYSQDIANVGHVLDNVQKGATKTAQIAQYIPVTGTVLNLGLAGTEAATRGSDPGYADEIASQRYQNEFGMTKAQFDAMDPSVQAKMHNIRNIGYGLAPLDFLGLTGLAKSEGVNLAKDSAIQFIKEGAIDEGKTAALKTLGVDTAKSLAKSTAIGTGISAAGQQYVTGKIDPLAALKTGITIAGTNELFNPTSLRKASVEEVAPGVKSANPNQIKDAVEHAAPELHQTAQDAAAATPPVNGGDLNTPAFMRGTPTTVGEADAQARLGVDNLPAGFNDADARVNAMNPPGTEPNPLDVPTFLRKNADSNKAEALTKIQQADQRIEGVQGVNTPSSKFADDQAVAAAYKESPAKGKAMAAYVAARRDRLNPGEELVKAISDKNSAARDYEAARQAGEAQRQLENGPATPPVAPTAVNPAEVTPPVAPPVTAPATTGAPVIPTFDALPAKAGAPAIAPTIQEGLTKAAQVSKTPIKAPPKTPQDQLSAVSLGGTAKTGEKGKSEGQFSKGQEYEKSSAEAGKARGELAATNTSFEDFTKKINEAGGMTGEDRDTAIALQKRFPIGSDEHRQLGDLINKYHTEAAQTIGTIEKVQRQTADAKTLADRFANKLYKNIDDAKVDDKTFEGVIKKNEAFTAARDTQNKALEDFNANPNDANTKAFLDSFKGTEAADREAKFEEYQVAADAAKGSKSPSAKEFVKKLESDAGVYKMDWVDSSMLSSTRVMLNNFLNTAGARLEESLFGKAGAALARTVTGEDVGGGNRAGAKFGAKYGQETLMKDMKLRQNSNENILTKTIKNYATTGNTLGERNISATAYSGIFNHYRQVLKEAGYSGDELKKRTLVNSLADPDNVKDSYMNQALASNALSSVSTGKNRVKLETALTDGLSAKLGDSVVAKIVSKAVVRTVVGFPTVIARSAELGAKRVTLGIPSVVQAVANAVKGGPKEVTAMHIKNAVKEAGSGTTMMALGVELGQQGVISGAYPTNKDEQAQWKREGKTENSIKIDGNWYSLPAGLGVFALPLMMGANAGSNLKDGKNVTDNWGQSTIQTLVNAAPTSSLLDNLKGIDDAGTGKNVDKWISQTGSSIVKAVTPLGSLTNEVAKMFDPKVNDTTKGDALAQFMAKVQDGIPGWSKGLPDKVVEGHTQDNPGIIPKLLGATGQEQSAGVQQTQQIKQEGAATNKQMADNGTFTDGIRNILPDDATKYIFDQAKGGKEVLPADQKKLLDAITKNVDATKDTRFLEDGDHASNLAVLHAKRDALAKDKTTTEATLKEYDDQITRGEIYRDNKVPYDLTKKYKDVSLSEWRNFGDPESDTYNPDLYQKLYDLDNSMKDRAVSRNTNDPSANKYFAKKPGKGKGGRGGSGSGNTPGGRGGSGSGNTPGGGIGNLEQLKKIDFGSLSPQKVASAKIPTIQAVQAGDLIKKRAISVSKV